MSGNIKGIIFSLCSVVSFAAMGGLVRAIPDVSSFQTSFIRFAIGLGIIGILGMLRLIPLQFSNRKYLLLRGLAGGLSVFLFYLSIVKLGIGKSSMYVYSYPVFATVLSMFILKEKVQPIKFVIIFISLVGLVLLSFGRSNSSLTSVGLWELVAIAASITSALSVVFVKKLHDTDNSYAIFFSQSIIGFWLFLIPSGIHQSPGSTFDFTILLLLGFVATIGQLFMTEGYRYVNVSTGSLFQLLVPVLNITSGYFIFEEHYTMVELLGALIIIGSCSGLVFMNYGLGKKARIMKLVE